MNSDGDVLGDVCDGCFGNDFVDFDNDGVGDICDNCWLMLNLD